MTSIKGTLEFLQVVFPDYKQHAIFTNLYPAYDTRSLEELDATRDCYMGPWAYPDDGVTDRGIRALEARCLVIDDVGTAVDIFSGEPISKVPFDAVARLGKPTAVIRTSPENYHYWFKLDPPVAAAEWRSFRAGVAEVLRVRADNLGIGQIFRLPMGRNSRRGFDVELADLNAGAVLKSARIPRTGGAPASTVRGRASPRVHDIRRLVRLIPNADKHYDEWIADGQRIVALALDQEEGRKAWHELSARSAKNNPEITEAKWHTFTADATGGQWLIDEAYAVDPGGADAWWQGEAGFVFDDGVEHPEVPPGKGQIQFELGSKREILKSRVNAERGILGLDIKIRYDAFHHRMQIERDGQVRAVTDHLVMLLRVELTEVYGRDFGTAVMWDAVISLSLQNQFNPVVEMLEAAEAAWDGVKRLDRLGPDWFHAENTEFVRTAFRKTMLAAVRRARRPGCKFDQILVCESPEGWDKSSAWAVLAGEGNFSDAPILGKDARAVQEELADVWIHEIAELAGLSKAEAEHVKAFASRVNDRARPAYGRTLINQPRQSIEVGTTNAEKYLPSTTGNRRFWSCRILKRIDTEALKRDRLQLWGEAAAAESRGESLVLPERLWPVAGEEQEERRVIDTWEIELENLPPNLIEERSGWEYITSLAVQEYLSGYRRQTFNSGSGRKIAEIMRRLGWEGTQIRVDGRPIRGYKRQISTIRDASGTASGTENPF